MLIRKMRDIYIVHFNISSYLASAFNGEAEWCTRIFTAFYRKKMPMQNNMSLHILLHFKVSYMESYAIDEILILMWI